MGTVGTIGLAMVGALTGSAAGLAWCKPADPAPAQRMIGLLALSVLGGVVGLGLGTFGARTHLEYQDELILVHGELVRVEPPRDPNGYLQVQLFGFQVYKEVGPREEMIVWQRRLVWYIIIAFVATGACLGLLLGLLRRRSP